MRLKIIDELKKAKPKKRATLLQAMNAKNVAFFKRRHPDLGIFLEKQGTGDFEIRLNDEFLDVIQRSTGQYCHPPGRLLEYIYTVANWHHSGWIDKMEVVHRYTGAHEHGELVRAMLEGIHKELPEISARMRTGIVQLPKLKDGRRFSGSTVFLGALTGLHIVQYLNTTDVRDVVIIEPDINKFILSCWFLDYEAIEKHFKRLVMHIGEEMPENPLNYLLGASPVTASVWMRILPIYPSKMFDEITNRINLRWRVQHEVLVPFDRELRNLTYGAMNLRDERPILCKQPELSAQSRIAVVGSGPSLDQDMEWLKANRDKLIVFAVHSAVRALKKNGIQPDFQCTLDTEIDEVTLGRLGLDPEIPLVAYYKMDPVTLKKFKTVLLVPENGKANAVNFQHEIYNTHPTSGNLTVAVATFMRSAEVYLLGLDFGFRSTRRSHVSGSLHDDEGDQSHLDAEMRENVLSKPNFAENEGVIFTHAYYTMSRITAEAAIKSGGSEVKVFNLSDGVMIEGAEPLHSGEAVLECYQEREVDLKAIHAAFASGKEGVWSPFSAPGNKYLATLKESLLESLRIPHPSWLGFATALDLAWTKTTMKVVQTHKDDVRMEVYGKLIQDALSDWYRVMIFTRSPKEFSTGYTAGLKQFELLLDKLHFPPELDFILDTENTGVARGTAATTGSDSAPNIGLR